MQVFYLYIVVVLVIVLGYCGDNKVGGDKLSEFNDLPKDNIKTAVSTLQDDGSWVAIIEGRVISKDDFERTYTSLLKMSSMTSGVGMAKLSLLKDSIKNKIAMRNLIVNIELAIIEAMASPFFKTPEGKSLIEIYTKQALSQYYLLDKVWHKVKDPSDKELTSFFEKFIKPKSTIKAIKTQEDKNKVIMYYRNAKLNELVSKELSNLALEKKVKSNKKVLLEYIKGKIKKDLYKNDKSGKYWVLKVDSKVIYLEDISAFLDLQLKGNKLSSVKDSGIDLRAFVKQVLNSFKMMELTYQSALRERYFDRAEVKSFIKFFKKKSIADFFITKEVLNRVKRPTDKDINEKLKDRPTKEKAVKLLTDRKVPITDKNIKKLVKNMIYTEGLRYYNKEIIDELKESYQVKISKKYFETESDKLQEEILKKD